MTRSTMAGLRIGHVRRIAGLVATILVGLAVVSVCVPRPPGDFYDAPDPLPRARPGTLIWAVPVTPAGAGLASMRVMYHSRDARGRDVAVTGTVSYPDRSRPPRRLAGRVLGPRDVGHGAGLRTESGGATGAFFGVRGIAVASDYIGLGPNGQRHAYLSGKAEGHSMIDIVRAVRQIPAAHAGRRWVSVGVSQGGHASLFAGELARRYAPGLSLEGVVAAAPGSGLLDTYPADNPLVVNLISVMALYGIAVDHPRVHPDDYVTPLVASKASVLDTGCLIDITAAFGGIPRDQLFTADPRTTEPARSAAQANDPGRRRTAAPVLLVQGTADAVVVPERTAKLRSRLCAIGDSVSQVTVPGGTHDNTLSIAGPQVTAWLNDRLAGVHAISTC